MADTWPIICAAVLLCSIPSGLFLEHDPGAQCTFINQGEYDCSNANLTSVPESIPGDVTVLYLTENNLTVLRDKELLHKGGGNIEKLYIISNCIRELGAGAFTGLNNLSVVVLHDNNITVFSEQLLGSNTNMEELYLGRNPLQLPDSETSPLLSSASLTTLSLTYCGLTRTTAGLFSGLPKLETLNLSGNRLTAVNWGSINYFDTLLLLDLDNNDIRQLTCQPEMVLSLSELSDVQSASESLDRLASRDRPFGPGVRYVSLTVDPEVCDCCFSLMTYALKKRGWFVIGGCAVFQDSGLDIATPEPLTQCYTAFMEGHNSTAA